MSEVGRIVGVSSEGFISAPREYIDDISELQYGLSSANTKRRWEVYKLAQEPIDFTQEALNYLALKGDETILDIGCGDAHALVDIRRQHDHSGWLIGVDIDEALFTVPEVVIGKAQRLPLDLRVGTAQDLTKLITARTGLLSGSPGGESKGPKGTSPIEDESIDVIMAHFMLYHIPQPEEALKEFVRVLRPGGTLTVATSSPSNKLQHRIFEKRIAKYLSIQEPPIFSSTFDSDIANQTLPKYFKPLVHNQYFSWLKIDDTLDGHSENPQSAYDKYLDSLKTMHFAFTPPPSTEEWYAAVDAVVKPVLRHAINTRGAFWDTMDRHLFILQKPSG